MPTCLAEPNAMWYRRSMILPEHRSADSCACCAACRCCLTSSSQSSLARSSSSSRLDCIHCMLGGTARHGKARHGTARHGKTRQDMRIQHGTARMVRDAKICEFGMASHERKAGRTVDPYHERERENSKATTNEKNILGFLSLAGPGVNLVARASHGIQLKTRKFPPNLINRPT